MLTVPEAARRTGRNPETIRRWIRQGRLAARKIGTQHFIEEEDLAIASGSVNDLLPAPAGWDRLESGGSMPDWVSIIRGQRSSH